MTIVESTRMISGEIGHALSQVSEEAAERLCDAVLESPRIFLAGAGRSGLMTRAFAMRLMHLGCAAAVVGETVTPSIEAGDLLVVCSGSGETASLVSIARNAKKIGSRLAVISIFPDSSIGRIADLTVRIPAPTPKAVGRDGLGGSYDEVPNAGSLQPMGSLFEQCLLLLLDAIVLRLMERLNTDGHAMFRRHANLE